MLREFLPAVALFAALLPAAAPDPTSPDPNSPRPIEAVDNVFLEDLTWMEVRDAIRAGKDTVIVATGGVEMNGPYLVTGKHNVVLRGTTEAIARKLGNALVAPIVPFVPEGDIDPPTGMMRYPGSLSVTEATFQSLLTDICASLRTNGFKNIILIGDSGGNQDGMKAVAAALSAKWTDGKTRIRYIPEYFNYADVQKFAKEQGIQQIDEGHHDDYPMTAVMMSVDPHSVRTPQRVKANKFTINGIDLAPQEKTVAFGRKVIDFRADVAVKEIRAALAK